MNNDELKKKVIDIIHDAEMCSAKNNCDTCKYGQELMNYKDMSCRTLKAADALIAAEIDDTSDLEVKCEVLQRDVDNLTRTMEEGADELKEAQRRAEVLEQALKSVLLTAGCFHGCIAIDDGETCSMCKLADDLCLKIILSQAEKEREFTEQRKNGKR